MKGQSLEETIACRFEIPRHPVEPGEPSEYPALVESVVGTMQLRERVLEASRGICRVTIHREAQAEGAQDTPTEGGRQGRRELAGPLGVRAGLSRLADRNE